MGEQTDTFTYAHICKGDMQTVMMGTGEDANIKTGEVGEAPGGYDAILIPNAHI